jgi:hypothetical protein
MIGTVICIAIGYFLRSKCGPRAHARLATNAEKSEKVRKMTKRQKGKRFELFLNLEFQDFKLIQKHKK